MKKYEERRGEKAVLSLKRKAQVMFYIIYRGENIDGSQKLLPD